MKRVIFIGLLVLSSSVCAKGFYGGASLVLFSSADVAAPSAAALHPVDSDNYVRDNMSGHSASLGYRWNSGWFAELGAADLTGTSYRIESGDYISGGSEISSSTRTKAVYDIDRYHAVIGKIFRVDDVLDVYIEGGPSTYSEKLETRSVAEHQDATTSWSEVVSASSISKDGTTYVAGFGFHAGGERIRARIGIRYYGEPAEAVTEVGFRVTL